ncbi:MAG: type II toxin-antitoxin system antitoxin SocA domain-containing protein [Planctomycetota bacterium]
MERDSLELANWFLDRAERDGRSLTLLQVLKLVYIAHGWHLAFLDEPLVSEQVEAWKHGPVLRSIYRSLAQYGGRPIDGRAMEDVGPDAGQPIPAYRSDDGNAEALLTAVWNKYGRMTAGQLYTITHEEGSPWAQTWHEGARYGRPLVIDNDLIKRHYLEKKKKNEQVAERRAVEG